MNTFKKPLSGGVLLDSTVPEFDALSVITGQATELVCALINQSKTVTLDDLSALMNKATSAVITSWEAAGTRANTNPNLVPAVPIEESVKDDYIVCLEDGKHLQMLKRHLKTVYNMTLAQYKERWGLSSDYPVVAPSYARRRSDIAKVTGLGNGRRSKRHKLNDRAVA